MKRSASISAVIDLDTHELTAGYRLTVAAAAPVDTELTDEFWRDLAEAIAGYFTLVDHRPTRLELKRWRKVAKQTAKLEKILTAMCTPERTRRGDMAVHALFMLCPLQDLAEAHVAGYEMIVPTFQRRQNPHRFFLFGAVLDLWHHRLGLELSYSRTRGLIPSGPLIRFFAAVVSPILGDETLGVYGIATTIDDHRAYATLKIKK